MVRRFDVPVARPWSETKIRDPKIEAATFSADPSPRRVIRIGPAPASVGYPLKIVPGRPYTAASRS